MKTRIFDRLPDGAAVTAYRLDGSKGAYVEILDYGAIILGIHVPDRDGILRDVTLGHDEILPYTTTEAYFGATVGRHANRIGYGKFTLNGVEYTLDVNNGPHHLHGGFSGYNFRFYQVEEVEDGIRCSLHSPEGDQGYPGNFDFSVTFRFTKDNALHILYEGVSDRDTVVNLTNHSYFDLSAGEDPQGQKLWLEAEYFTENDENNLPTGKVLPVKGTAFDFTVEKAVGQDNHAPEEQIKRCKGYDHNFVLTGKHEWFGRLRSEATGIRMAVKTDLPGVQLYGANFTGGNVGKGGRVYKDYDAVCLETQFFPNAINTEGFEAPILKAGEKYRHETVYWFTVEEE